MAIAYEISTLQIHGKKLCRSIVKIYFTIILVDETIGRIISAPTQCGFTSCFFNHFFNKEIIDCHDPVNKPLDKQGFIH